MTVQVWQKRGRRRKQLPLPMALWLAIFISLNPAAAGEVAGARGWEEGGALGQADSWVHSWHA